MDLKALDKEKTLEFESFEEIYFPNACLACGQITDNRYTKTISGKLDMNYERKEYNFSLPICKKCNDNITNRNKRIKREKNLLIFLIIIGIILSLIFTFLLTAIIFGIAIFSILLIFPYLRYRKKKNEMIKLEDLIIIQVDNNEKTVKFTLINENYARSIKKLNLKEVNDQID